MTSKSATIVSVSSTNVSDSSCPSIPVTPHHSAHAVLSGAWALGSSSRVAGPPAAIPAPIQGPPGHEYQT
jgi:hypothetical protein